MTGDYAYLVLDAEGESLHGPEDAQNPEELILRARGRGENVVQVYHRPHPQGVFMALFGNVNRPLPRTLEFRGPSWWPDWRERKLRANLTLGTDFWVQLTEQVRAGAIEGAMRRFPSRVVIGSHSLLRYARRQIEGLFGKAIARRPDREYESRRKATEGIWESEKRALSEDPNLEEMARVDGLQERFDEQVREILRLGCAPPKGTPRRARAGDTLLLEDCDDDPWEAVNRMLEAAFGIDSPFSRLGQLAVEAGAEGGYRAIRLRPGLIEASIEYLADDGRREERGFPLDLHGWLCWWFAAAAGASPDEMPPMKFERAIETGGTRYEIRLVRGIVLGGETLDLEWKAV